MASKKIIIANILEEYMDESSSSSEDFFELTECAMSAVGVVSTREEVAKVENFVEDVVKRYTEKIFKKHFRMTRNTTEKLLEIFENSDICPKKSWCGGRKMIPTEHYILIFLWFVGNKSSYRQVSNLFGIAESTVFNIVNTMMEFLVTNADRFIRLPISEREKEDASSKFYTLAGFPNVIGCIDGSYIRIRTPANKLKGSYINRHDDTSITLQVICNADRQFIDVFTGAPSKVHDARVFKMSPISSKLPNICGDRYHILGDAAYGLREYLLTPYKEYSQLSAQQRNYNEKFCRTRVLVENSFGILKRRFLQLQQLSLWDVDRLNRLIMSCCVLHNICIAEKDQLDFDDIPLEEEPTVSPSEAPGESERDNILRRLGEIKRDNIAQNL